MFLEQLFVQDEKDEPHEEQLEMTELMLGGVSVLFVLLHTWLLTIRQSVGGLKLETRCGDFYRVIAVNHKHNSRTRASLQPELLSGGAVGHWA